MLNEKEKALIGVGAAVAAGCQPCTEHLVKTARAAGACDHSLALAVETAVAVRESATRTMDEWAGQCQGERPQPDSGFRAEKRRFAELTAVAAAFAVNSVPDLRAHLQSARECGATLEEIRVAIAVAGLVKKTAEEKVAAFLGEQSRSAEGCCSTPASPAGCVCG
jgi:alkylhydroperoxidase/carboxymuconolactone decarboxylase family protein YurZ